MPTYFFDSSSLVKRYSKETGTAWVINIFKPIRANRIYAARITFVEVISALARKARGGQINSSAEIKAVGRFRRAFHGKFRSVEVSVNLTEHAAQLARKHFLRGYDAVQLAAALEVHQERNSLGLSPLTFVCADDKLNDAAKAEGLAVENPNNYP